MMWIAIVDMQQPDVRQVVAISDDDRIAEFETVEEIEALSSNHPLGVFTWIALNIDTGEVQWC